MVCLVHRASCASDVGPQVVREDDERCGEELGCSKALGRGDLAGVEGEFKATYGV